MVFRFAALSLVLVLSARMVSAQVDLPEGLQGIIDLQNPPKNPQNARELAILRAYYDETVWKTEVKAQSRERTFVHLWDSFIHSDDHFSVLADAAFARLKLNQQKETQSLDWGIQLHSFVSDPQTLSHDQWRLLVGQYEAAGYEILDTEWHHSTFATPDNGPAWSTISMVIEAIHREHNTRYLIKGDLIVTWSDEPNAATGRYDVVDVDASKVQIYERTGDVAFSDEMQVAYSVGDGVVDPTTIHPIILYDLDGDHLPEIIVAWANEVHWNLGEMKFEKRQLFTFPPPHINCAVLGDFDGDGATDILCGLKNGYPQLYRGTAEGTFPLPPKPINIPTARMRIPVGITAGDIDGDGDLDVFIGQNKTGYQTGEIPTPYYDANDSFPSILLKNRGSGEFFDGTAIAGLNAKRHRRNFGASFIDLDGDLDLDLLLTNDFCGNDVFLNDGQGTFEDISDQLQPRSYAHGMSHTFGDYNLDGRLDFLTIGMSSTTARRLDYMQLGRPDFPKYNEIRGKMGYGNRLYLNTENGFVQAPFNDTVARTGWSWGSTTLDFDRDGDQDVYVVNGQTSGKTTMDYCTRYWCHDLYFEGDNRPNAAILDFFNQLSPLFNGNGISWNGYEHNALLMNRNGQGFVNVGFLMGCGSVLDSRAAVSGDLDLDGRVDLIYEHADLANRKSIIHLLRNTWDDTNHWIGLHLHPGTASPHVLGTQVTVELTDGRQLIQHHVSGHSVWTQHPATLHFGTGADGQVARVRILWPTGVETVLEAPELDQYHVVAPPDTSESAS